MVNDLSIWRSSVWTPLTRQRNSKQAVIKIEKGAAREANNNEQMFVYDEKQKMNRMPITVPKIGVFRFCHLIANTPPHTFIE